jgi:6-pyruvoyl tetrahydropterin synthase/QueD family protein
VPIAYLTRVVEFAATHRLPGKTFGKAGGEHGHRYQVRVTVQGELRPRDGGVVDLIALDQLLAREITAPLEGRSINDALPKFADGGWVPTGEALAVYIWERLAAGLPPGVALYAVRVQEGPHLYSEYFGE